ncbi:hypothetical protein GJ496_011615 [Pomphorhynchus laevis]|nr:hypothetical protein GJ496_011615 [Pomphorhynchus laevis]
MCTSEHSEHFHCCNSTEDFSGKLTISQGKVSIPSENDSGNGKPQIFLIRKFKADAESWPDFLRQLQLYFEACVITDAACKKACLLSWLSPTIFGVVSRATTAVQLDELQYDDIIHLLNKHFCDFIHEISARFKFYGIRKKKEPTYNERKNDLEGAVFGCRFYKPHITSEAGALAECIRDVIASFAPDEFVRRAALQEKDLSLDRLIKIAANFEAMANAPTLSNSNPIKEDDKVFRIENAKQRRRRNHKRNVNKVNYESDVEKISNIYAITGKKIARILVRLNGVQIEIQFDTGSAVNIIPMLVLKAISLSRLVQTNKLRVYGGGRIEVMGKCTLIVESTDKLLFGLPWALNFALHIPADIIYVEQPNITSGQRLLDTILHNFEDLFESTSSGIQNYMAKLCVSKDAIPTAWPFRRIPYSLQSAVKVEIKMMADDVFKAAREQKGASVFPGLANYHWGFVPRLQKICQPLYEMLCKDMKWRWSEQCEKYCNLTKEILANPMTLYPYDHSRKLVLTCDASDVGVGASLYHVGDDAQLKTIAFASRVFSGPEKNYSVIDKRL